MSAGLSCLRKILELEADFRAALELLHMMMIVKGRHRIYMFVLCVLYCVKQTHIHSDKEKPAARTRPFLDSI